MLQQIIFGFLTSFGITFIAIPSIIAVANIKHLYDEPGARKSHSSSIPTLGGLAIFAGVIFSISFWTDFSQCWHLQYIIASIVILFFIGIKDDIIALSPFKKIIGQLVSVLIVVIWGDIRISSFSGIFGVYELPEIVSIFFSIFVMLLIINAYNLIDGINGLSASIGIVSSLTFGVWFYMTNQYYQHSIMAFALAGSLLAFLRFNVTPAKIFMGDTGSMLVGFIIAVFAVEFVSINETYHGIYFLKSGPVVAMGIIAVPIFDLLRVFIIRFSRKKSPFKPDKSHIHHTLLKMGYSHSQASFTLTMVSILLLTIMFVFDKLGNYYLLAILLGTIMLLVYIVQLLLKRHKSNSDSGK